jgi:hypothetical protein
MPQVTKLLLGSQTTLLSTGLNSLANNSLAISAAFDNTIGAGGGDGYLLADFELVLGTVGSAYAANTGYSLWILQSQDGTNYEDGGTSTTPARPPDVVFPVQAITGAQRIMRRAIEMAPGLAKYLLKNDGTGQTMNASGNTLKVRPYTPEFV